MYAAVSWQDRGLPRGRKPRTARLLAEPYVLVPYAFNVFARAGTSLSCLCSNLSNGNPLFPLHVMCSGVADRRPNSFRQIDKCDDAAVKTEKGSQENNTTELKPTGVSTPSSQRPKPPYRLIELARATFPETNPTIAA